MIDPPTAYNLEKVILTILSTFYGLAMLFYSPPRTKVNRAIKLAGFGLHLFALLAHAFLLYLRIVSTGRAPFMGIYETLLFASWCVSFVFMVLIWRDGAFGYGRGAALVSWVAVFAAFFLRIFAPHKVTAPRYLPPLLNSAFFEPHVITAFLAYGCFTMAFFAALTSLGGKDEVKVKRRALAEFYLWPGVILFTISLGLGAVWSRLAWGQWWITEPKFAFSLATWGLFLLALFLRHCKATERKAFPWLIIGGYAVTIFTYLATNKGLHSFM